MVISPEVQKEPQSPSALATQILKLRKQEAVHEETLKALAVDFLTRAVGLTPEKIAAVVARIEVSADQIKLYLSRRDGENNYHPDEEAITTLHKVMRLDRSGPLDSAEMKLLPKFQGVHGTDIAGSNEYLITIALSALDKGNPESDNDPNVSPPAPAGATSAAVENVMARSALEGNESLVDGLMGTL